jgi:phosphoesterase RecJ-like protein
MMSIANVIGSLKKYKSFLISTHVNPDPDALCSEMTVYYFLKSLGKKVTIVNEETVPSRLKFLVGTSVIKAYKPSMKMHFDAAVIVDCGTLERIGAVRRLIGSSAAVINIDHHITNDYFGTVNLVRPAASSTAEILYDVLRAGRCALDKRIAMHLYTGIMTDTGSFRYENTTSKTMRIAAELKEFGFSSFKLYQWLYEAIPASDMKYFTKVASGFELHFDEKVVCVTLDKQVQSKFSDEFDLRDALFRLLRSIKDVEVAVIVTQSKRNETRVNFRSSGRVDVAKLAHSFNGGGHHNASGCMIEKDVRRAKSDVLKRLKRLL